VTDRPEGILSGIRVLDFGRYIAGPFCAALLADLGADVIRIEKVDGSEDRQLIPVAGDDGGALFLQVNRNKRSLTLSPTKPEGHEVVQRLIATADVVVANLPALALESMGIDYASLTAVKPDIILTTVDAFGQGGPWSDRLGFDGVGQAMSGAAYLSGDPGVPSKSYVQWVDFMSATTAAFATMAALMERGQTGRGQHVRGSLLASALTVANSALIEQAVLAPDRVATHNRAQVAGPADIYRTSDGWIVVQVIGAPLFKRWANLLGEDDWLTDDRFRTDKDRGDNRDLLNDRMAAWCSERASAEALEELAEASIPAGPVLSPQGVLDHEHIRSLGFLKSIPYPGARTAPPLADTPVTINDSTSGIRTRAPLLGEHTDEILLSLDYDGAHIKRLREQRVV